MRVIRVSIAVLVLLGAGVFLQADKKAVPPVWVLSESDAGISTILGVWEDRVEARIVQRQIADSPTLWRALVPAPFHAGKGNKHDFLGLFLAPLQAASFSVTPQSSFVLPPQNRNGEFISPAVNVTPGVSEIALTMQVDPTEYENPTKGLGMVIEYSLDNEATWGGRTGSTQWQGGHQVNPKTGEVNPNPNLASGVVNWPGYPIRLRIQTCQPLDHCTPGPITVGATVTVR